VAGHRLDRAAFSIGSVAAVGVLMGVVFLAGWFSELVIAFRPPPLALGAPADGILFLFAAFWSFASPFSAFWALAAIFGLLLIFPGSLDLVTSISARDVNSVWWLGMLAGILEILLGFWVSQQRFPARAVLLLIWSGSSPCSAGSPRSSSRSSCEARSGASGSGVVVGGRRSTSERRRAA